MQITETLSQGLKREYKVSIPAASVTTQYTQQLQKIGAKVKMPGFRPGKVPMQLLEQRYSQDARRDVIETSIEEAATKIVKDNQLRPSLRPIIDIESFDAGQDLVFSVKYEVLPEIDEVSFDGLAFEKYVLAIDDKQVDEAIQKLADRNKQTKPIDATRPAKKGDLVIIDFDGSVDGKKIEGGQGKKAALELGSNTFIPGFEDQIIGHNQGENFDIHVNFPEAYHEAKLAGKPAVFAITLHEIRESEAVKIDEEFAKNLGMESLSQLQEFIKKQIGAQHNQMGFVHVKRQLLDKLAEHHDFEIPSRMVEQEFENIWHQLCHELEIDHACGGEETANRNGSKTIEEATGQKEEEARKEYQDIAARRVRLGLLLADIGKRNNINISNQELSEAMWAQARSYPGQEKEVIEYYRKNESAMAALRAPLFEDKVVQFILGKTKVTEKPVSAEEMVKLTTVENDGEKSQEKKTTKKTKK